jgi:ABC-type nickel/cobalt efflux system permease component RcnA
MLLAVSVLVWIPAIAAANPFQGRGSVPQGPGSSEAVAVALPGPIQRVLARISLEQRRLNATLSRQMRAIRETRSSTAALAVGLVAFVYGVLHAAGPGHGKLVISAFFLGRDARILKGVLMGGLISLLQTLSAIAVVSVFALLIGRGGFDVLHQSTKVEVASYGLIVVIGLYMFVAAITGRHHAHRAAGGGAERRVDRGMVVAAGLTPCASALILLLFALAQDVFAVGIAATFVMALGMGITVSLVGVTTIVTRRTLMAALASRPRAAHWIGRSLTVTGAVIITVVGILFFSSAWSRLM